jgi:hypothetical protein
MKDYIDELNEIKGIYTQKLGKRKANVLSEEIKEENKCIEENTDNFNNEENEENKENIEKKYKTKEKKIQIKKKKVNSKVPGVNEILNSEEAKNDIEIVKNLLKRKKKLKANISKNPENIQENMCDNEQLNKLDTAQKNINIINNVNSEKKKNPDSVRNFTYIF